MLVLSHHEKSFTLSTIIQVFSSLSLYKVIIFALTLATAICKIYGETNLCIGYDYTTAESETEICNTFLF